MSSTTPLSLSAGLTVFSFDCVLFVFEFLAPNTLLGTEWVIANVCWTQRDCLILWDKCSLYDALDSSVISWSPPYLWSWHECLSQVSAKLVISVWLPEYIRDTTFHHQLLFFSKTLYIAQHPLGNQSKYNVFTASICHLECIASLHGKFLQVHISFQNESLSILTLELPFPLFVLLLLSLSFSPLLSWLSHSHTHTLTCTCSFTVIVNGSVPQMCSLGNVS